MTFYFINQPTSPPNFNLNPTSTHPIPSSLALLASFYPMACPRCPFHLHLAATFAAAWAVSGASYAFSIAQDAKAAQLSVVVLMVRFKSKVLVC